MEYGEDYIGEDISVYNVEVTIYKYKDKFGCKAKLRVNGEFNRALFKHIYDNEDEARQYSAIFSKFVLDDYLATLK